MDKQELDHHANQKNPNNTARKNAMDNHGNQLNPNNPVYGDNKKRVDSKF